MPFDNEKKKIFPFIGDVTILAPFNVRVQLSSFCFSSRFLTIWLGCRCEIFGEWSSIADATHRDGIRAIGLIAMKIFKIIMSLVIVNQIDIQKHIYFVTTRRGLTRYFNKYFHTFYEGSFDKLICIFSSIFVCVTDQNTSSIKYFIL